MATRRFPLAAIMVAATLAVLFTITTGMAQERGAQPPAGRGAAPPAVVSPEVMPDRRVAFRILAAQAENVGINGSDIPALAGGRGGAGAPKMVKGENGVWEVILGPLDPGAYRYNFSVSGVSVIDPRNPAMGWTTD